MCGMFGFPYDTCKAYEAMTDAVDNNENPYKALNSFIGTNVPEDVFENL